MRDGIHLTTSEVLEIYEHLGMILGQAQFARDQLLAAMGSDPLADRKARHAIAGTTQITNAAAQITQTLDNKEKRS